MHFPLSRQRLFEGATELHTKYYRDNCRNLKQILRVLRKKGRDGKDPVKCRYLFGVEVVLIMLLTAMRPELSAKLLAEPSARRSYVLS